MVRTRVDLRAKEQPKEPPPTMTLRASQLGDGVSKMKVNQTVKLEVTGKVIQDSIDTYLPGRPRRFQVEISKVRML